LTEQNKYHHLRMTIDVCVFEDTKTIKEVVKEGAGEIGVGERLAREFTEAIINGTAEIDDIRDVEVH
jgi:hypothetical protein